MNDYTLVYNNEDGKLHVGHQCGENEEQFVGEVTEEVAKIEGYEGEKDRLVLNNFNFETTADIALSVPNGTTIIFVGNNRLEVFNDQKDANVAVLYSNGDMIISGGTNDTLCVNSNTRQGLWSRAICARGGNLTIQSGNITTKSGPANRSCGLYAGGHIWIDVKEKGEINLNGGEICILAKGNAIRAAEGKLTIADGSSIVNAVEYTGGNLWKGDCLTARDKDSPLVISF